MPQFSVTEAQMRKWVDVLVADQLEGGTLRLFTNDYTPTPQTVVGDLTEATFGGYGNIVLTGWNAAANDGAGGGVAISPLAVFSASGVAPAELIYGFYILGQGAGNPLVLAGRFASAPIPMGAAGDALPMIVNFDWQQQ